MKLLFSVFCFLNVFCYQLLGQTGFYLIVDGKEMCTNLVRSMDEKQEYCIPKEPIIKEAEFKIDGELQYDSHKKYRFFNICLSKSGFETLKLIQQRFDKNLVFVVNGKAVGIYEFKDLAPSDRIPISSPGHSKDINLVYTYLKNHH